MFYEINLTSIYVSNFIAVILLIVLFICNFWRFQYKTYENKIIISMMLIALISSFVIVITYVLEGKEGSLIRFVGHVTNSYIFISNMVIAFFWMLLIETHLKSEPKLKKKLILSIPMLIGLIIIVINLFVPCIYELDELNYYHRKELYWAMFGIDVFYILYALILYIILKIKGGVLKFFPIYLYIGPILTGMVLETIFPGIAISWPCLAISIAGVLASLQNETIYSDQLTGLYNRNYLNFLQKNMLSKESSHFTGIMLDMNDFKMINDEFGHAVGDEALRQMAKLLKEAIGDMGIVLRYAGDEFIVLINSHKQVIIDACIKEIKKCIDNFNESNVAKYKLSASMGYSIYKSKEQSIDDFMNVIDQKMYEDKKKYHNIND